MSEFYVNATGDDSVTTGNNSSTQPWRKLRRAIIEAADGDTIYVDANTPDTALRNMVIIDKNVTIRPLVDGDVMYLTPAFVADQDNWYENTRFEDYMQNTSNWAGYIGTTSYDTSAEKLLGTHCRKLDGTASRSGIRRDVEWTAVGPVRFRIGYKCADGVAELTMACRASGEADFNFTTEEWQSGYFANPLPNSTTWAEFVTPWIDGRDGTSLRTQLDATFGTGIVYIQYIIREYQFNWVEASGNRTFHWEDAPGGTEYTIDYGTVGIIPQAPNTWFCSTSEWTSGNIDELVTMPTQASVGALTAGDMFHDDVNDLMYYTPNSGEVISDLHIEFMTAPDTLLCKSDCTLIGLRTFATQNAVQMSGAGSTVTMYDTNLKAIGKMGLKCSFTGDAIVSNNFVHQETVKQLQASISRYSANPTKAHGSGIFSGGSGSAGGTITINGGKIDRTGDDGIQSTGTGALNIYGVTLEDNLGSAIELVHSGTDNATHTFNNVTARRTSLTTSVDDTIYMDQSESTGTITVAMNGCAFTRLQFASTNPTRTYSGTNSYCENSAAGGTGIPTPISDGTMVTYNADFDLDSDMNPSATSDLIGTGTKWWTGPEPVGANGEPFSDMNTDAGGIQSLLSDNHPVNI